MKGNDLKNEDESDTSSYLEEVEEAIHRAENALEMKRDLISSSENTPLGFFGESAQDVSEMSGLAAKLKVPQIKKIKPSTNHEGYELDDLLFKPQITQMAHRLSLARGENRSERFRRLSQPRTGSLSEKQKRYVEEKKCKSTKELTFRPNTATSQISFLRLCEKKVAPKPDENIDPAARDGKRDLEQFYGKNLKVEDRLLEMHLQSKTLKKEKRMLLEASRDKKCPFKPKINSLSKQMARNMGYISLDNKSRRQTIQRQRQEKTEKLQLKYCIPRETFKPRICRNSVLIHQRSKATSKQPNKTVEERLLARAREMRIQKERALHVKINEELNKDKNKSRMCKMSRRIIEDMPLYKNTKNFIERQEKFETETNSRRNFLFLEKFKENTFAPEINDLSKKIAQKKYKMEKKPKLQNLNHDSTFRPSINKISEFLVSRNPNRKKYYETTEAFNHRFREDDEDPRRKMDEHECTFTPQINESNYKTVSHFDFTNPNLLMNNIRAYHERKEKRRKAEALKKKKLELTECTFQPKVTKFQRGNTRTEEKYVPGLEQHMQRVFSARRKKDEKNRLERKIFLQNHISSTRRLTIPQPFSFLTSHTSRQKV
eukprot:augustus_masked-scaffold_1-processed-gene-31.54-mRNA-1 protein AED:1.00 eAED:1.00 QI:0/-1/0/0/-1/1/1/0/601